MRWLRSRRPGVTFIELLLFLAIVSMAGIMLLPLFFRATENRLLQETISVVEHNGTQILQTLAQHVRHAERIVDPGSGGSKSVLALQTSSGSTNPTIFGVSSGSFIMVQHTLRQTISSPQVAVTDFRARNTSASATRQSVEVSFKVSRSIRLEGPRLYTQVFSATYDKYPDDATTGGTCGAGSCAGPACVNALTYGWQVCSAGACQNASTDLTCQ